LKHHKNYCVISHQHRKGNIPKLNPPYDTDGSLVFPTQCTLDKIHVTKVTFVGTLERDDPTKHPAPDPILLAARAAVTFARRHNIVLAAAAEPAVLEEYDDENWTELDQLAAEQYLAQRAEALRPSSDWATLARSLGQPFAT
jgi:hypothetical protein